MKHARGLLLVLLISGSAVAQDEATSVIFGMPAETIKCGAADQVLGLDDIYAAIEKRVLGLTRLSPVGAR